MDRIDAIFSVSKDIRYVAVYKDGRLQTRSKSGLPGASAAESDRYEELLVNPTLLKLATQRGNIDCGGLEYFVVRYGSFFQLVLPAAGGHVSICIDKSADPIAIALNVQSLLNEDILPA
jgi:hypothetical protein